MSDIKEKFPLVIYGSKTKELKKLERFFPLDVKTVIEPFAGSFAVIRYFYSDDKYMKIINDSDTDLINLYLRIAEDPDAISAYYDEILKNPEHSNSTLIKAQITALGCPKLLDTFVIKGMFKGRTIISKQTTIKPLSAFFNKDNIDLFNEDWRVIMDEYKDNPDAFIFLDPPYFNSFNLAYYEFKSDVEATNIAKDKNIKDNSLMFIEMLTYLKTSKAKIMIIISETALTDYILKEFKRFSYPKTYGTTGKKTNHIIYTNYETQTKT